MEYEIHVRFATCITYELELVVLRVRGADEDKRGARSKVETKKMHVSTVKIQLSENKTGIIQFTNCKLYIVSFIDRQLD